MKTVLLYWRLAIFRVSGKTLIAIALSIAQGLNGAEWSNLTPTQKFVTVTLAIGTGWAIIDAFMDNTMNELRKSRSGLGLPETDTQIIKRNEVAASQPVASESSP